jgi:hypothetical protein
LYKKNDGWLFFTQLSTDRFKFTMAILRHNTYETYDRFMLMDFVTSHSGSYYDFERLDYFEVPTSIYLNGEIFRFVISLGTSKNQHQRELYNLLDFIGDLGGVFEILVSFFSFFIMPISEHSFILKALSKLFLARTSDAKLFVKRSFLKPNQKYRFLSLKT